MFYSYLFSNDLDDLNELPSEPVFVILSQDGYIRCTGQDVRLLPMVKAEIRKNVIRGDKFTGCHYFLLSDILPVGQHHVESLLKRLEKNIQRGTTYNVLITAQRIINTYFEEVIATLIDSVSDDDHALNVSIFVRICDIYGVLEGFNGRYRAKKVEWERKIHSYKTLFCREKELVAIKLR